MKVYAEDVKRYLSSEDHEKYVAYKKIWREIKKEASLGIQPPEDYQEIKRRCGEMLREVKAKKAHELMQLGRREFIQYEERIDSLISKVKGGLSQRKEDPYTYLISRVPKLNKLAAFEPWNWCQLQGEERQACGEIIRKTAHNDFGARVGVEVRPYLTSRIDECLLLPLPQIANYVSIGKLSCLQWKFLPHGVAQVAVSQAAREYPRRFRGLPFTLSLQYQLLGYFTAYIPPESFDIHPMVTIPLNLLYSLSTGELETKEARIMEQHGPFLTYHVDGLEDLLILHQEFLTFLRERGETSLGKVLEGYGLIDDFTLEIMGAKLEKEVSGPKATPILQANDNVVEVLVGMGILKEEARATCQDIPYSANLSLEDKIKLALSHFKPKGSSPPGEGMIQEGKPEHRVTEKDKKYLRKLSKTSDYLSYREWGKLLGLGRSGTQYTLRRLENIGSITLTKHPSGDGVRVTLTSKGEREIGAK